MRIFRSIPYDRQKILRGMSRQADMIKANNFELNLDLENVFSDISAKTSRKLFSRNLEEHLIKKTSLLESLSLSSLTIVLTISSHPECWLILELLEV
jgi:transcriptional regulator NrdR family protein